MDDNAQLLHERCNTSTLAQEAPQSHVRRLNMREEGQGVRVYPKGLPPLPSHLPPPPSLSLPSHSLSPPSPGRQPPRQPRSGRDWDGGGAGGRAQKAGREGGPHPNPARPDLDPTRQVGFIDAGDYQPPPGATRTSTG